jgi:hypothetical protein
VAGHTKLSLISIESAANKKLMSTPIRLRADTHVHFHDCFEEGAFLNAAADALCGDKAANGQVDAVLCLTESYGANWFARLYDIERNGPVGDTNWKLQPTDEENSVVVEDSSSRALAIIAGRQIVCQEGLEVLAIGGNDMPEDGQPIRSVLQQVSVAGVVPVLPWGFGKWLGQRGQIVADLIKNPPCHFLLGDNGGRLAMFGEPKLFSAGRESGFAILPGTDSLPFSWNSKRVGSYGIEWDGSLNPDTPFASLRSILLDGQLQGRTFGPLEHLPAFFRNQVAIRLRRFTR